MDYVSGEKLELLCHHIIGVPGQFNYNPAIRVAESRFIDLNDISGLLSGDGYDNKHMVFCYSDLIEDNRLKMVLMKFKNKFTLILHNSDQNFEERHKHITDVPNLVTVYTQNIDIYPTDKILPLPIGIQNKQWRKFNLWESKSILELADNRKNEFIYFNFACSTNPGKRNYCKAVLESKGLKFMPNIDTIQYLSNLSRYKYVICPNGNGIDTHRLWEALYLKVIPICKKNHVVEYFTRWFPIIVLEDWMEIDLETLEHCYDYFNNWENYELLKFEYFKHLFMVGGKE